MAPDVRVTDDDHAVAVCGQLLVVLWRRHTRPEALRELREITRAYALRTPPLVGTLVILAKTATVPDSAARAELDRMYRTLGAEAAGLGRIAHVVEHDGFAGATIRGVMAGLVLVRSRSAGEVRVFKSVTLALEWLATSTGTGRALELERQVEALRSVT